jgi:hypothetical protein
MTDSKEKMENNKELRILRAVKRTLTGVVKDTATEPGLRHPLSTQTVEDIRQCLGLISAREQELQEMFGEATSMRPRFIDEPSTTTTVSIDEIRRRKKSDDDDSEDDT